MRINEIELRNDLISTDVADVFRKYGWQVLGTGYEGSVAQHPNKPYVLKLFYKKSLYKEFIAFCLANRSNIHLPKFYTGSEAASMTSATIQEAAVKDPRLAGVILEIPGNTSDIKLSAVRMERLIPISENTLKFKYAPELFAFYLEGINQNIEGLAKEMNRDMRNRLLKLFDITEQPNVWLRDFASDKSKWPQLWTKLGRSPDALWLAVSAQIVTVGRNLGLPLIDIREDNLMRRGSILVITDPFGKR